jgi:hypothetical protein
MLGPASGALTIDPWVLPLETAEEPPPSSPSPESIPVSRARSRTARSRPARAAPSPLLPTAPSLFPWLARRFSAGEATIWAGPPRVVESLLEWLYAGSALAHGRISLLEGANRFHPYRVGEVGRQVGADPGEVLERIRLARAFTAYQLVALVDAWSAEARRARPTLLVAHELPALFANEDVREEEREPLLRHVATTLRALARDVRRPLLLTLTHGPTDLPGLLDAGPSLFDFVRFHPQAGALRLEAYREAASLRLVPRSPGQRGLEEFVPPDGAEEVAAWGGRPRRTARRSKSG